MSEWLRGLTLLHNSIRQDSAWHLHVQRPASLAIQKSRAHVCHQQAVASLKAPRRKVREQHSKRSKWRCPRVHVLVVVDRELSPD